MLLRAALDDCREDRQDARREFKRFASLIASHGDLAAGFQLPGDCTLFASTSSVLNAAAVLVDLNEPSKKLVLGVVTDLDHRELGVSAGAANKMHRIGVARKGRTVIKHSGAAGTVSLYIADGYGTPVKIAQG